MHKTLRCGQAWGWGKQGTGFNILGLRKNVAEGSGKLISGSRRLDYVFPNLQEIISP